MSETNLDSAVNLTNNTSTTLPQHPFVQLLSIHPFTTTTTDQESENNGDASSNAENTITTDQESENNGNASSNAATNNTAEQVIENNDSASSVVAADYTSTPPTTTQQHHTTIPGTPNNDDATSVNGDDYPRNDIEYFDVAENSNIQGNETQYKTDDFIGPETDDIKPQNTFRVFGCNPNGFKTLLHSGDTFAEYCEELSRLDADTWCFYETNLDTTQSQVRNALHTTIQRHTEHSRICYGSTNIPSPRNTPYKPGGTLIASQGKSTGRITTQGTDSMGRWSYQVFSCRGNKTLTIISAYQVCRQSLLTVGEEDNNRVRSFTASAQQLSMLRQANRGANPREAFISDLTDFIRQCRACNSEILLVGDFNEALSDINDGMTKLCSELQLHDLMGEQLGSTSFATFVNGHERIDYALCTPHVSTAVTKACYEPFKHRDIPNDHRNMVIDFNIERLFGNSTQQLGPIASRDFTSKDRSSNRVYIEQKYKFCVQHNFASRLDSLKENWNPRLAERLDRDFQRAGEHASRKCAKKPRGIPFVKQLASLRTRKNLLLKLISAAKWNKSFDSGILYTTRNQSVVNVPTTLEACQQECRIVQRQIREMTKDAVHHRHNALQAELNQAIASGNKQQSKALKHRMAAERTKAMYAKLRQCRGNLKTGITRLDVPADPTTTDYTGCTEWLTIDTPEEIEDRLLTRNRRHFGQAHNTFPTKPPFSEWCDWGASTHTAELILEGDWQSEELDEMQQSLIDHMKARVTLEAIPAPITKEEWMSKIKIWPESTTTSPSGFHLGHSKALVAPHDLDTTTEEGQEVEAKREALIEWQVGLINCALVNNYSYERWKHIVNVMILKEPNNLRIHRLRVIHLYEQDYNLVLAIKWRQLIQLGTNQRTLHPMQFGGVPGRDAVIPTLCEELQYEISRASKRPLVHLDYDATACYDRIVLSFGSLASRSFGQHRSIVFVNAKTLEEAKYYLKTKLGVSERHYQHCQLFPIYGSGQGAGNSPAIWCVISTILFDTYDEKANGSVFHSPDGSVSTAIHMIGFVDDTSGSVNDFLRDSQAPPEHYIEKAQSDAQRWNDLLSLSGGALNVEKCSYHFLYYTFNVDGLATLQPDSFGPRITIKFHDSDQATPIKQLSSYRSHKTLGVQKSPFCTDKGLFLALAKKNQKHASVMASSPFSRTDAWAYYHAIYLPSICYPLPSSTLSDAHCNALQVQFKKAFLPKYGFNRHMPNAIVYGPSDLGGLGLRTLSVERGISQTYLLLACLRSPGVPAKLANIAISWAQFLAGTSVSVFEDVSTPIPYLAPMKWIPQVRQFLHSTNCHIELEATFLPKLQRENDRFLMDLVLESMTLTPMELQMLNACRMYLGVTLLSDIVTPDGKKLSLFTTEYRHDNFSTHHGLIPYQTKPSSRAWNQWHKLLELLRQPSSPFLLATPLGRWLVPGHETYRHWKYLVDCPSCTLYVSEQEGYRHYWYQHPLFLPTSQMSPKPPPTAVPAHVIQNGPGFFLSPCRPQQLPPTPSSPNSFLEYTASLARWDQQLLSQLDFLCPTAAIHHVFQTTNRLLFCSDGSAALFTGKFGSICSTPHGQRLFHLRGPAPGYRTSSFRSESYGMLAILRSIFHITKFLGLHLQSQLLLYTDSKSLIQTVKKRLEWAYDFPYSTMEADWDIQQSITYTLRQFPVIPQFFHVRGHQDRTRSYETLPLPAQLNVDADRLAEDYEYPASISSTHAPLISGSHAMLHTPLGTVHSNYRGTLRYLATWTTLRDYLTNKYDWPLSVYDSIDWPAHGRVIKASFARRHFLIKLIHDWLPLGYLRSRYAVFYSETCPLCTPPVVETRTHFLRCPHRQWKGSMITELQQFWRHQHLDPNLSLILTEMIHSWLANLPPVFPTFPDLYRTLITNQRLIGFEQLFLGRFSRLWSRLQDSYLSQRNLAKRSISGTHFVTGSIKIMWKHIHNLWITRNQDVHGNTPPTIEAAAYAQAQREVCALYDLQHQVPVAYRDIFYSSTDAHFEAETSSFLLRSWINTWRPVISRTVSLS